MFRDILVADGNVESRYRFYEVLFSLGHKLVCVPNSNEVLVRLQAERPYLLILGQDLSPEGGLKTLEKIREFDRQIKVVFLTQNDPDIDIQRQAHRLGAAAVVKKDFSSHFMFKTILEILKQIEGECRIDKYPDMGRILLVDDTLEMRLTLMTFLKMRGFNVRDAASGDQALMDIRTQRPDLVLLDERMPGMDGLMVLKKIKELDSLIKIVMLTAIEDEDIIQEAKRLGACDYITKPFDLEKLEALIASIFIQQEYR